MELSGLNTLVRHHLFRQAFKHKEYIVPSERPFFLFEIEKKLTCSDTFLGGKPGGKTVQKDLKGLQPFLA